MATTQAPENQTHPQQPTTPHLIPANKFDIPAIEHLHTLPPSTWTPLILFPSANPTYGTRTPLIDYHDGLLTWIQDSNWPIAYPTSQLLLTLLNPIPAEKASSPDPVPTAEHTDVLVGVLRRLFEESEDWEWLYNVLVAVVAKVDGEERREAWFGDVLRRFLNRVSAKEEEDYGFREEVVEIVRVGEDGNVQGGFGSSSAAKAEA